MIELIFNYKHQVKGMKILSYLLYLHFLLNKLLQN